MKVEYIITSVVAVLLIVSAAVIFLSDNSATSKESATSKGADKSAVPYVEIQNPAGFVNTGDQPIKIGDYIGKQVILLDIMTYSCINCQRSFPYVAAWYEKYKDDGLIVIGIHTPEFAFEKEKANVEKAMKEFGINFPVVLDNDYATWNALGNKYWPRKYLIDINGNIVYDHIGEGGYEETEEKIQELLKERATVLGGSSEVGGDLAASKINETKTAARSPETYFGSLRNELLKNGRPGESGVQSFNLPTKPAADSLYFGGSWNITGEYAEAKEGGVVEYRYNAKEVYIVAESEAGGTIEVWQDGEKVGEAAGADAPAATANVKDSRLYKLIKNPTAGEHLLELKISPGVKLFAFTFG